MFIKPLKQKIYKLKLLFLGLIIGIFAISSYSFIDNDFEIAKNLDVFSTLFRELNLNYVDETKPGELMKTAIDAMLESLDPYTNYIPESELEDYKFLTTGQYGGVGALIHKNGESVVISEPYEGFPAFKAGLKAGDVILEINGKPIKGKSTADISTMLKGQPGTEVKVLVKLPETDKTEEKTITREEIKIENIPFYGMLPENTAYIKLNGFTQNAGKEVRDAYNELKTKNTVNGVIIDLRGNGGGLLNEAVNICNIFIEKNKTIVSTKGKLKDRNTVHKTINQAVDVEIPLVVLVDRGSASASEIVAGAMQDLDRGVIVGQRTYGKGLVQNVVPLTYNSKLKVTIAKYYIPSGRCIQAIDYSHRNEDGSVGKIADSLKVAFKTSNGRIVYDGGGVNPDIILTPREYSNIATSLIVKYLIFDYATHFRLKNNTIAPIKSFEISDEIYNDFITFLTDKEYDYTTKSEKSLKDLKEFAEKEKYFDALKPEYEALKAKMMHNKKEDLIKFKNEIKILLKDEIISRYYFQKGKIESTLLNDEEIKECINVLKDTKRYQELLQGSNIEANKKKKDKN